MNLTVEVSEQELADLGVSSAQLEEAVRSVVTGPMPVEEDGGEPDGVLYLSGVSVTVVVA